MATTSDKPVGKTTRRRTTTTTAAPARARRRRSAQPTHEQISERAYHIYLQEGSSDEVGNWIRAERELKAA